MNLNLRSTFMLVFALLVLASPVYADTTAAAASSVSPSSVQPSAPAVSETPGNITLDFKEADINTVLRVLSLKSKMNIVAGPEVEGTVTIRLENVHWQKALEVVLRTYDYVYEKDENIIRVTTREKMSQEPVVTQTFILNYTKAEEVKDAVKDMLTERGRIKPAARTNTLIITDIPTNLYRIKEVVMKLDQVTPQAFVDSKIIKTDIGAAENLGIEWKTGGTSNNLGTLSGSARPVTFPFFARNDGGKEQIHPFLDRFFPETGNSTVANTSDPNFFPIPDETMTSPGFTFGTLNFANFQTILQLLKTRANTKVVSNPRIVVLNNQSARVQVGSDIPIPTFERNESTGSSEVTGFSFRNIGVVLKVTPHINSQREILVDLQPEVSTRAADVDFGDFLAPSFNITTAITQVLIKSGETIAIGGLMTDNTQLAESRVPYLSDIPVVGKLFRSKRQTEGATNSKVETLFFVTVSLVDTAGQKDLTSADNGKQAKPKQQASVNVPAANIVPALSQPAVQEEKVAAVTNVVETDKLASIDRVNEAMAKLEKMSVKPVESHATVTDQTSAVPEQNALPEPETQSAPNTPEPAAA